MLNKYSKCQKCPAFHLLTDDRIHQIEQWEFKRDQYLKRTKHVLLILLGESMPANRYFYDINTKYENGGLRYTLKREFNKLEVADSEFLQFLTRTGIVLFDCALCPLHLLKNNTEKRKAATYCLLSINHKHLTQNPSIPIVTIFPKSRGYLKSYIPDEIKIRIVGEMSFMDQSGLKILYERFLE